MTTDYLLGLIGASSNVRIFKSLSSRPARSINTLRSVLRAVLLLRMCMLQLEIDYDSLTKEEFVTLIGILNKSEHMKKHISRRGKVPALFPPMRTAPVRL